MSCRHGSSAAAEMSLSRDEQRGTAPLLPNVPETQTEAHRGCTHGMPCPHWHWVPADSRQVSHPALATGLHMVRLSKVALHPPQDSPSAPPGTMVPSPSAARSRGGLCVRLQHQAPLLGSGHASHIVPEPPAGCWQGSGILGRSGQECGLPISWQQDGAVLGWCSAALMASLAWICWRRGGAGGSRAADGSVQGEQEGAVPGRAESGPEEQR